MTSKMIYPECKLSKNNLKNLKMKLNKFNQKLTQHNMEFKNPSLLDN